MFGLMFYHQLTRSYVASFGTLFNDIFVQRFDTNGVRVQTLKVPIAYGPKEKWMRRRTEMTDLEAQTIGSQFPRISFELTGFTRDTARQVCQINKMVNLHADEDSLWSNFQAVPWNLAFTVYVMATNADDAVQIVEQIMPYFTPEWNMTTTPITEMGYKDDTSVIIQGDIGMEDDYTGDIIDTRIMTFTLNFTMRCRFYGPVIRQGIIKRAQIDLLIAQSSPGKPTPEEMAAAPRSSRILLTPGLTANGTPTEDRTESIPYQQIKATDDWGFADTVEFYTDEKKFDPVTGTDKSIPED